MPDFMTLSAPSAQLLSGASLFLDLDGTILELANSPDGVVVTPRVLGIVALAQQTLAGRVAILSGRSADDVAALFPGLPLNISGSHGVELVWSDSRRNAPVRAASLDYCIAEMQAMAARHEGLLVEAKPYGAALHYRLAPHLERECRALAQRLSEETGLPLQPGKMVQELKSSATSKGDALAAFMAASPMRHGAPLFLGDDDNDEPGFAAAARLGGAGILVGPERPTAARWRLGTVAATLDWLQAGLEVLR
jgi:trehalose 6-phosphate phosphatase